MKKHILLLISALILLASCQEEPVGVTSVSVDKENQTISIGSSFVLKAIISPSDADNQKIIWTVENSSVVDYVDNLDGSVTLKGLQGGSSKVTARTDDGGFTAYCNVVVITPVTGLSLDPGEYTLESIGSSFTITPIVSPEDASDVSVVWKSLDTDVVSVSSDGTVTAVGPGTATVTATTYDGAFSASCTVTVKSPAQHVILDKTSLKLLEGETDRLVATVCPSNSTEKDLTWSSDAPAVASVDGEGKVTAVKAGTARITVKVSENVSAVCEVTVISRVTGISLDKTTVEIKPGETYQLTATVLPANASDAGVTWYSDKESIATVSQSGLVTGVGPGEATVHAVTSDGGKMASCLVKVGTPVKGVTLSISSKTLYVGDSSLDIRATISPENATDKSLEWSSSDPAVASVIPGTASAAIIKPLKSGTATITATTKDGGYKASCIVTVKQHVTSVSLNNPKLELYAGESSTLTATVLPSDASDKSVTWSSSNTSVASVSNGKVTAVSPGTAVIKVKTNDSSKEASCTVTVKRHVSGVTLNKSKLDLHIGESESLTVTVSPSDATDKSVTWTSSNTSVADVSDNGKVTPKSVGTADITVTTKDGNHKATCSVTVKEKIVYATSLILTPGTVSMDLGSSQALTLAMLPANTNEELVWSSSNESVVKVAGGDLTAVGEGTAKITVKGKNVTSNEVTVTVIDKYAVTGVTLNATSKSLQIGETFTLAATVSPSDARDKSVSWSSSNESVAKVVDGVVTAVSTGTATIQVKTASRGFTANCVVTVVERTIPITEISYPESKTGLSLKMGQSYTIRVKVSPDDANEQLQISPAINCPVTYTAVKESGTPYWNVKITAIYKEGRGALFIDSENFSTQCMVSVSKVSVTGITLDATETSMRVGQTLTLTAAVAPSDASIKGITWTSSDSSVAYVSQSGIVTAKSSGKVVITATSKDNTKILAKCTILVRSNTVGAGGSEGVGFIDWN